MTNKANKNWDITTQLLWACKKQNLGEWEIKNFPLQQIFDLIVYDIEIHNEQNNTDEQSRKPITYEQALEMVKGH